MAGDSRVIPKESTAKDLVMTHVSSYFDRTGFQQDWNVLFPLARPRELEDDNVIGSVAASGLCSSIGFSDAIYMGNTICMTQWVNRRPKKMLVAAKEIAGRAGKKAAII
jgi:hypothetical protein